MQKEVDTFQYVEAVNRLMRKDGILLVAEGKEKKPNTMTIGWGFLGTMWAKPVFVVAVRHSRHTFKLMEEADSFTVCLPAKGMADALDYCGTKSGRDVDKLKQYGWTAAPGKNVKAPYIKECPVHFECRIIYKDDLKPGILPEDIEDGVYKSKDMHMLYYGEVKGVYADEDADKKLME